MNQLVALFANSSSLKNDRSIEDAYNERYPNEEPVETELETLIRQFFETHYGAEVHQITLRRVDTDITERLRKLQKTICSFDLKMFTPDTMDIEPVVFSGDFQVKSVDSTAPDSWDNFLQLLESDIETIKQRLQKGVEARLGKHLKGLHSYADRDRSEEIEAAIEKLARACIREEFGLDIQVRNLEQHLTSRDIDWRNQVARWEKEKITALDRHRKMLVKAIDDLIQKKIDLLVGEIATDEDINACETKINKLIGERLEMEARIDDLTKGRTALPGRDESKLLPPAK